MEKADEKLKKKLVLKKETVAVLSQVTGGATGPCTGFCSYTCICTNAQGAC